MEEFDGVVPYSHCQPYYRIQRVLSSAEQEPNLVERVAEAKRSREGSPVVTEGQSAFQFESAIVAEFWLHLTIDDSRHNNAIRHHHRISHLVNVFIETTEIISSFSPCRRLRRHCRIESFSTA